MKYIYPLLFIITLLLGSCATEPIEYPPASSDPMEINLDDLSLSFTPLTIEDLELRHQELAFYFYKSPSRITPKRSIVIELKGRSDIQSLSFRLSDVTLSTGTKEVLAISRNAFADKWKLKQDQSDSWSAFLSLNNRLCKNNRIEISPEEPLTTYLIFLMDDFESTEFALTIHGMNGSDEEVDLSVPVTVDLNEEIKSGNIFTDLFKKN